MSEAAWDSVRMEPVRGSPNSGRFAPERGGERHDKRATCPVFDASFFRLIGLRILPAFGLVRSGNAAAVARTGHRRKDGTGRMTEGRRRYLSQSRNSWIEPHESRRRAIVFHVRAKPLRMMEGCSERTRRRMEKLRKEERR